MLFNNSLFMACVPAIQDRYRELIGKLPNTLPLLDPGDKLRAIPAFYSNRVAVPGGSNYIIAKDSILLLPEPKHEALELVTLTFTIKSIDLIYDSITIFTAKGQVS